MKPAPTCTGNISNQKYEAAKNVRQHFIMVTNAIPTQETSRWRDEQLDHYHFQKQKGRLLIAEKQVNEENLLIEKRLQNINNENRREKTQEYAPGLRVGTAGTCIDCYPSNTHHLLQERKKQIQINQLQDFHEKRLENNKHICRYLKNVKSSYERERLLKEYEEQRATLPTFAKTSQTAVYLGLLSTKELLKTNKSAQIIASSPRNPSSVLPNQNPSNSLGNEGMKTQQTRISGNRPLTAGDVKKIHHYIKKAKESARPVSAQQEFQNLEKLLTYRNAPPDEIWDYSPNNHLYNSNYNDRHIYSRDKTIYAPVKEEIPNYLMDRSMDILTFAKQQELQEKERQSQQMNQLRHTYPQPGEVSLPPHRGGTGEKKNPRLAPSLAAGSAPAVAGSNTAQTAQQPILFGYNSPPKKGIAKTVTTNIDKQIQQQQQQQQQEEEKKEKQGKAEKDREAAKQESEKQRKAIPHSYSSPAELSLHEKKKSNEAFKNYLQQANQVIGIVKHMNAATKGKNVSFLENVLVKEYGEEEGRDGADGKSATTTSGVTMTTTTESLSVPVEYDEKIKQSSSAEESKSSPKGHPLSPTRLTSSQTSGLSAVSSDDPIPLQYDDFRYEISSRPPSADSIIDVGKMNYATKQTAAALKSHLAKHQHEDQLLKAQQAYMNRRLKREQQKEREGEEEEEVIFLAEDELIEALNLEIVSKFSFPIRCDNIINAKLFTKNHNKIDVRNIGKVAYMMYEVGYCLKGSKENYQFALSHHEYPAIEEVEKENQEALQQILQKNHRATNLGPLSHLHHQGHHLQTPPSSFRSSILIDPQNQHHPPPMYPNSSFFISNTTTNNNNNTAPSSTVSSPGPASPSKSRPFASFATTMTSTTTGTASGVAAAAAAGAAAASSLLAYSQFKHQNLDSSNSFLLTCTGLLLAVYLLPHSDQSPARNKTYHYFSLKDLHSLFSSVANDRKSKYRHQASDIVIIFDEIFSFGYLFGDQTASLYHSSPFVDAIMTSPTPSLKKVRSKLILNRKDFAQRRASFRGLLPQEKKRELRVDEKEKNAMIYPCIIDMMDQETMMAMIEILTNHIEIRQMNPNATVDDAFFERDHHPQQQSEGGIEEGGGGGGEDGKQIKAAIIRKDADLELRIFCS